jgi:8-oxo-dGTP pyrophosphatase MutT (NUDIX family)
LIGGHLEDAERLEDGLVREVQEEVGATPTAFTPIREGARLKVF